MACTVVHYKMGYDVYGARPSPLGNPFRDGSREENVAAFVELFTGDSKQGCELRAWVRANIRPGDRIACHCAPRRCHLDVVARYVNNGYKLLRRR